MWKMLEFQFDIGTLSLWPLLVRMFAFLVSKCLHSIIVIFGLLLGHTCVNSVRTLNKYVDGFTGFSILFRYEIWSPNVSEYCNHSLRDVVPCSLVDSQEDLLCPEAGGSRSLQNVCSYPLNYTASIIQSCSVYISIYTCSHEHNNIKISNDI